MKKIAYLILAHTDPQHFHRLINALGQDADIYVHIDQKSQISDFKTVSNCNVQFLENRVSVSWAGISMIDAQIELMKTALQRKTEYTHLVFLSGSCYPIKKAGWIQAQLTKNPHREFIKFIDMRQSPEHYMKQISRKWFKEPFLKSTNRYLHLIDKSMRKILNTVNMGIKNDWNEQIIPYFGSQWCALTVDCCSYILDYQERNPWYREMNRFTFSPDEHYIHTIVGNSFFREKSDGVQPFLGRGTWRLANLHIIDSSLSKWFTLSDWEEIRKSDKFFVRKVRSLDGSSLVERIDREILL